MRYNFLTDVQWDFMAKRISFISDKLGSYVCPILYYDEKKNLSVWGSSILLTVANKHFLITAKHVLASSSRIARYLWGSDGKIPLRQLIIGAIHHTGATLDENEKDEIDLAYFELVDNAAKILREFSFLSVDDLDLNHFQPEITSYITIGYPTSQTKPKHKQPILKQQAFAYITASESESVYQKLNKPHQLYLVLKFDENKTIGDSQFYQKPPSLHGMSGGGVWALSHSQTGESSEVGKLIGINLGYCVSENVILAVRIFPVLARIEATHPYLADRILASELRELK